MLPRRRFLQLAAAAAALPPTSHGAPAQTFPSRPVRIVVPTAAGGPNDILTRLIGQWLSERLGQPVIVENRPGAGTNLATEVVVRSPPDGYTLFSAGPASAINATLYDKLGFNFLHDTAPVAGIMRVSNVLVVSPSFPARTVPEFIAYAKANPGKLSMASGGIGSGSHMVGELFKQMAGLDMVHVPYRGAGPALADVLGGQVQVMLDLMPNSIEHIRAGKLRGLAVTTATRSEELPDIPTVGDFVPRYEASAVFGIFAPANTPAAVVDKLNNEINAGLADSGIKARLAQLGGTVLAGSAADLGKLFADETAKWSRVIRAAHIKAE
jgi:tripartite-type tricarboxylate transporter receptor subunit TctC